MKQIIKVSLLSTVIILVTTSCNFVANIPQFDEGIAALQIVVNTRDSDINIDRLIHLAPFANDERWLVGVQLPRIDDQPPVFTIGTEFWIVELESKSVIRVGKDFQHLYKPVISPAQKSIIFTNGTGWAHLGCADLRFAVIRSFDKEGAGNLEMEDFDGLPTTNCSIFVWSSYNSWIPYQRVSDVIYESPYRWLNENEIEVLLGQLGGIEGRVRLGKYVLNLTTSKAQFIEALLMDPPRN